MADFDLRYFVGSEEVREIAERIADGLRDPGKYEEQGISPANRILINGIPGVGRETLVRCIAGEAEVGISFVSAFEFVLDDYSERIHRAFTEANEKKPCILCINDFEILAKENPEKDPQQAMRLSEFFRMLKEELDPKVCLIAVADIKTKMEKTAVRSFRTQIRLAWPNRDQVMEFISRIAENSELLSLKDQDLSRLAFMSDLYEGFYGFSDIKSSIDDAIGSILYRRSKKKNNKEEKTITGKELIRELEKKLGGTAQKSDPSTAYHEAGHAVMSYAFHRPLKHVSIMRRGMTEGYSAADPDISTRKHMQEQIIISMAGRAAELQFLGKENTDDAVNIGAGNDFQKATSLAYNYFKSYAFDTDSMIALPAGYPLPQSVEDAIWEKVQSLLRQLWGETCRLTKNLWIRIEALACTLMYTGEVSGALARRIIEYKQPIVEDERDIVERLGTINGRIVEIGNNLILDDKVERICTCIGEVERLETLIAESVSADSEEDGKKNEEALSALKEKWQKEPLNERLRRVIGAITNGEGAGLTLNQKLELVSNPAFLKILSGEMDEELAEPVEIELPTFSFEEEGIGKSPATVSIFTDGEDVEHAPITKKLTAFLLRYGIFPEEGEDVFSRFLETTTEHRAITHGCQVYPPVAIGYRSYSQYGEVEENDELYYVVKSLQQAEICESFNKAMGRVFELKQSDPQTVCRCFTEKKAAVVYANTLDVILKRENGERSMQPAIDGVGQMDEHKEEHDTNEWLYYVLEFGEKDMERMNENPLMISERLNSFSKLFNADDINLFFVIKLWGSARMIYKLMNEWSRRTLI